MGAWRPSPLTHGSYQGLMVAPDSSLTQCQRNPMLADGGRTIGLL
jgi:hypothetical protein